MKKAKLFKDVKVGQKFSFRYGSKGERGPMVKLSARRYRHVKAGWVDSVAVTDIQVR